MSCCCNKILQLCSVNVCSGEIDFGILAQVNGNHKLIVYFDGVPFTINKTFEVDDPIKFPPTDLNENYDFLGELYDPDGKRIAIEKNDVVYDCVRFKTTVGFTITEPET